MTTSSLVAAALSLTLIACATQSVEDPVDVVIAGADGKADGLNGKRLALTVGEESLLTPDGGYVSEDVLIVRRVTADKLAVAASSVSVAALGFEHDEDGARIIHDVAFSTGLPGVEIGMVILDEERRQVVCQTPRGKVSFFRSMTVDFDRSELTLNRTTTVPMSACGLDEAPHWIALVPVPVQWPASFAEQQIGISIHYVQR